MERFKTLTGYIEYLQNTDYSKLKESDFKTISVNYPFLSSLRNDVYALEKRFPDSNRISNWEILKDKGIAVSYDSLKRTDVSSLNSEIIIALLSRWAFFIRSKSLIKYHYALITDGTVFKWLYRLKEIDDETSAGSLKYTSIITAD